MAKSIPYKIATIGSHSALQILKGAKDEGFSTIVICKKQATKVYRQFRVADSFLEVDSYTDFLKLEDHLIKENAIIIPHGSFIAYLGPEAVEKLKVKYFGNKQILEWESDRKLEREWLLGAGLKMPRIFSNPKEIDRSVIVKFHGAKGGKGYFIANSETDFKQKIKGHHEETYIIQEYIIGVPIYVHYFYSPLTDTVEIMGFDKRYESNVDSLGRISARDQIALAKVDPSYVIVGNIPLVVRESFLPQLLAMGEQVVAESKKIAPPGLIGPFCLETIFTPQEEIFVFEISARIVAGTNPYMNGSPYTVLLYDEPMSTGRRIAREIKLAIHANKLSAILH